MPYMGVVVAVTVICVLLFVLYLSMVRWCESARGDRNAGVGNGGGVVVVSARHEYVSVTRSSGFRYCV